MKDLLLLLWYKDHKVHSLSFLFYFKDINHSDKYNTEKEKTKMYFY